MQHHSLQHYSSCIIIHAIIIRAIIMQSLFMRSFDHSCDHLYMLHVIGKDVPPFAPQTVQPRMPTYPRVRPQKIVGSRSLQKSNKY